MVCRQSNKCAETSLRKVIPRNFFTPVPCPLDSPEENEHENDRQDQTQGAARKIAPATAVGPSWQCADLQDDEDD